MEQALVLIKLTTSPVTVLDLDTLEEHVTWTIMNVKLKNLDILMLLVLTTKALTSVTVNPDSMERIVTKILMTVEATRAKMQVYLNTIFMTDKTNVNDTQYLDLSVVISSVIY